MRYEIIPEDQLFVLKVFSDDNKKIAVIKFQEEQQAREYGEDALIGENVITWEFQDDVES